MPRCTGIDLFRRVAALAAREGYKVFLLGASPESNDAARRKLLEAHPSLRIVGCRDGFFRDSAEVVAAVNASGADVLFVAMGSPRQELWIAEHLPRLASVFCMGVGGSFDVVGGVLKGAPAPFRAAGLEWLYRVLRQPSRIPRLSANWRFTVDVLKAALAGNGGELLPSGR
jgi:N-acetylglucosaminyldiphosphoundecaprenol N-acetyl-beta-D-mannosaminyltransferase